MNKTELVQLLIAELQNQLNRARGALESATEGATGDDSKAESKYDTRGLESSYLAAGQAEQVDSLEQQLSAVEAASFPEFDFDDPVAAGALVEVERAEESAYYLLAPGGGGLMIESEDCPPVTILGPEAPLRQALLGMKVGTRLPNGLGSLLEIF
ncbi:MAG: transcription elongation factor GreAB [Verrucomicrobiota bacterium]